MIVLNSLCFMLILQIHPLSFSSFVYPIALFLLYFCVMKEDKDMNEDVSAALHTSPFEEEILITKKEYENLCSASDEVTVLRVQIELLQKEISSINIYKVEKFKQDNIVSRLLWTVSSLLLTVYCVCAFTYIMP